VARKKKDEPGELDMFGAAYKLAPQSRQVQARAEALAETERLLTQSRQAYREFYESAPNGHVTINAKGIIVSIDKAAATLLDFHRSKTQPASFVTFVAPLDRHKFLNHLFECRKDKSVAFCDVELLTKSGAIVPVHLATRCSPAGGQDSTQYWISIRHITERTAGELRRAHQTNVELEYLVRSRTQDLRDANASLRREVLERKKAEEQLRGHTHALEQINRELQRAIETAREAHQARLSSERLARQESENANRLKDEFLAMLSHELRTPLNAILGWIRLIRSGKLRVPDVERGLGVIERNAHAQGEMIGDLLEMSRIISGKSSLDFQEVDPRKMLETTVDSFRPVAAAKEIELNTVIDPNVSTMLADPSRLQQIIGNLMSNAIKFTPAQGRVEVRLARIDSGVELRVSDTGIGIGSEDLARIFDRFRQVDASTTRRYGGLGLGLSIARHLAEAHGGSLRAESEGDGKGATFTVTLPVPGESKPAPPPPRGSRRS